MQTGFKVVIPARYASTRFPVKVLADIKGKPMLQHVYERAQQSGAAEVVIATDHTKVAEAAAGFAANVCMTSSAHLTGSDRLAEVIEQKQWPDNEVIVNVQGDEPFIPPENIQQVAENVGRHQADMATLMTPCINETQLRSPDNVRVITDKQGFALYFSRAVIPYQRDDEGTTEYFRHIGLYAYRAGFLKLFTTLEPAPLELSEKLEQLRALWHGYRIHVAIAQQDPPPGVDTPEDLQHLLGIIT